MKKLTLVFLLSITLCTLKGYSQDTAKTLIHIPHVSHLGIYVEPEYQYGQLKNQFTSFSGGSAMLLFNNRFAIGISGQQSIDGHFSPGINPLLALRSQYGGIKLEYTLNPNSAIHLSFPLVVGAGMVSEDSVNRHRDRMPDSSGHDIHKPFGGIEPLRERYIFIQPGIQVEANLLSFLKLDVGANYRFAFPGNTILLPGSSVSGFSANVSLKIGLFGISTSKKHNQ